MANEIRSRKNLIAGTLSSALTNSGADVTLNSAALANLQTIDATNHAIIQIDDELVQVTTHTAAATTATIVRGYASTTIAAHAVNAIWRHTAMTEDFTGVLGYAQVVASQGSITTQVDLTGLTTTVTVGANRRIRISAQCRSFKSVADGSCVLILLEGAAQLQTCYGQIANTSDSQNLQLSLYLIPSAGAHTYKLAALRGGTGNMTMDAGATYPAFICVEDLGPSKIAYA